MTYPRDLLALESSGSRRPTRKTMRTDADSGNKFAPPADTCEEHDMT